MNKISNAAAVLGSIGGRGGKGIKRGPRTPEMKRRVWLARWGDKTHEQRFWEKVTKGEKSECWLWIPNTGGSDYGRFHIGSETFGSNRMAWKFSHGEIPAGLDVLHKCDNPICCNPDHLFLGTHKENMDDMMSKGRNKTAKGQHNGSSKLNEGQVLQIRQRYLRRSVGNKGNSYDLANEFNVEAKTILEIANRKTWRHI